MAKTDVPFADELPRLLQERGISARALARRVGVSDAHLSKIVRRANYKSVSPELAARVAKALDLGEGYFVEEREGFVVERIRADPGLRDRLYRQLKRSR